MKIAKANWRDVFRAKKASVETMEVKGYTLIENLFVDSSGFGMESELALTVSAFEKRVMELLETHGTLTAKITNAGQFQVYVGLFTKAGKSQSKKIANNTLEINYPDGRKAYRLHDTDIVIYHTNGDIELNTGGWDTLTTRARMNDYLPADLGIIREKGMSWVVDKRGCENCWDKKASRLPLSDGMKLKGFTV